MDLNRRWDSLWQRVAVSDPAREYAFLATAYKEPHRAYHTLDHVRDCLAALDGAADLAENPVDLELAIWFHDVVYRPFARDNEARSAQWARMSLTNGGADPASVDRVARLVDATGHRSDSGENDHRLIVDIDLSVFGREPDRFAQYENQVRSEYRCVPWPVYRKSRTSVLRAFLDRPRIYLTDPFFEFHEDLARKNLQRALKRLDERFEAP